MLRYSLSIVLLSLFYTSSYAYEVTVKTDAHDPSRMEYSISDDGCEISWFTTQQKTDKKFVLAVTRACSLSFTEQADYHEAILERINKDIPVGQFSVLSWGGFSYHEDFSWVLPLALASEQSATYLDYRQHYPHARINDINQIFVEIANQVRPFEPLAELFNEYNRTLALDGVEKVFSAKAGKLPFYADLREQKVGQHARVIYDAGMTYFHILPIPK